MEEKTSNIQQEEGKLNLKIPSEWVIEWLLFNANSAIFQL
jgi:hypothetical protein